AASRASTNLLTPLIVSRVRRADGVPHALHPKLLLLAAAAVRRRDQGTGGVRTRPGLAAVGRVHRRPAPTQRLLGDVGSADVRPHRPRGRADGDRGVPDDAPGLLRTGERLRRTAGAPDDGALVHRAAAGGRARVPTGPPGGQ